MTNKILNAIRKINDSVSFDESKFLKPSGYIDTGCYAVNRIISGNIYKGVPEGRITTFFGESGCAPVDSVISVLVKVNLKNSKCLNSRWSRKSSEITISYAQKIKWLEDIGYSTNELHSELDISRVTINKIKKGLIANIRKNTCEKIDSFIDRNTYTCKLGDINTILNSSKDDALVMTPKGFSKCSHLIIKGLKECYRIDTLSYSGIFSVDHLLTNPSNEWMFVENILVNDEITTMFGNEKVINKVSVGNIECVDIEIYDDEHAYYINGMSSHNSGKSRIVAQIIGNALTKNNYDLVLYYDSEGGGLDDLIRKTGADCSKIQHILVSSTEDAMTKMLNTFKEITEANKEATEKGEEPIKALAILDSFGMLGSDKIMADATEKGKVVADMGSESRMKNKFIKSMTIPVLKSNIGLIVINHIYDNPGQMHPTKIKEQPGGKGIHFASHVIVQSSKSLQKDKEEGLTEGESYFKGNNIRYFTVKNRLVKLGYEASMFVDLNYGMSKYDGLIEDAKRYGFITGGAVGRYKVPSYSEKQVTMNDILTKDEIWNTFIENFNKKSESDMQYGSEYEAIQANVVPDPDTEEDAEETLIEQ